MAPSSPNVAPSATSKSANILAARSPTTLKQKSNLKSRSQSQQVHLVSALNRNGAGFGRVTKSRSKSRVQLSDAKKLASENWCESQVRDEKENETKAEFELDGQVAVKEEILESGCVEIIAPRVSSLEVGSKRKRGGDSGSENGSDSERERGKRIHRPGLRLSLQELCKKRRVHGRNQLLSPPASRDGTDCEVEPLSNSRIPSSPRSRRVNASLQPLVELPTALLDLISMHSVLLKALSLHYAHNGASSPAELNVLMDSMTRLWKKHSIQKESVQRMFGLYEVAADSTLSASRDVEQRCSPFKIVVSGLGSGVRTNLEYVSHTVFSETTLQATYSDLVHSFFRRFPGVEDVTTLPLLTPTLGTQTSLHRAKAASTRNDILGLSAAAQSRSNLDFSKLSITEPLEQTPAAVKSRTLSLFDRVRAKGLASVNNAAPTPEQIARRHAIGRIAEVVEFLRMRQQQKAFSQFSDFQQESSGSVRGSGKVSFSLAAIVRDIRQSVGVPVGEEEVKTCLKILSQEVPGDWCRMIAVGSIVSVTLQGPGMSGIEVRRVLNQ